MEKQKRHTARIWQWLIPIIAILLISLSSQGAACQKAIPSEICNPTEKALDNINKERHNLAYMVDNASTVNFSNTLQRNLRNLQQQLKRDNKDESKTFATYTNTQVSTLEYTNKTKYRKGLLKKASFLTFIIRHIII